MGEREKSLALQAKRSGEPLPDRIRDAPKLLRGSDFYLDAFHDLDSERNHAIGYQRIPRSKIVEYAQEKGLDREAQLDLVEIIRRLDDAHIANLKAKDGKNSRNAGNKLKEKG